MCRWPRSSPAGEPRAGPLAPAPVPHGWIILDKPRGLGSTQAVGAVKRELRAGGHGRIKVGHGGTLDPLAEGVLPIALGEATKLAGRMLDSDKTYAFTLRFGEETDTLDAQGSVVARSDRRPTLATIAAILPSFTGAIEQVPPAFSALKVAGQRAYDLARAGAEVVLAKRRVIIHDLKISARPELVETRPELGRRGPSLFAGAALAGNNAASTSSARPVEEEVSAGCAAHAGLTQDLLESITLIAHVSKGTYIRSLARDIARALSTVGHVSYLRRTRAGPFGERQAISLDRLAGIGKGAPLSDILLPLEAGLDGIPALILDPDGAQAVRQGRVVSGLPHPDGLHLATLDSVPVALVELTGGTATVVRGFNL